MRNDNFEIFAKTFKNFLDDVTIKVRQILDLEHLKNNIGSVTFVRMTFVRMTLVLINNLFVTFNLKCQEVTYSTLELLKTSKRVQYSSLFLIHTCNFSARWSFWF